MTEKADDVEKLLNKIETNVATMAVLTLLTKPSDPDTAVIVASFGITIALDFGKLNLHLRAGGALPKAWKERTDGDS